MVSPHHRNPPKSSVSIGTFTSTKGSTRSLKTFKYRQQSKWVKKASLLRVYSKVMKKEGLEFQGRNGGSSSHRPNNLVQKTNSEKDDTLNSDKDSISNSHFPTLEINEKNDNEHASSLRRRKKVNPLEKSLEKAKDRRHQSEHERIRREEALRERDSKLRERKRTTHLLRLRTQRGQPVMKHVIHTLLSRLERKHLQDSK
jgi:rRNA processing